METVFTALTAVAALISAIIAAYEVHSSRKVHEVIHAETISERTIQTFSILQREVLDKFVSFSNEEIRDIVSAMEDLGDCDKPEVLDIKMAYHESRALIAKIEHFAVGVNVGIYDTSILNRLGGPHLIGLYKKVSPIIDYVRETSSMTIPYTEFEMLVNQLKKMDDK